MGGRSLPLEREKVGYSISLVCRSGCSVAGVIALDIRKPFTKRRQNGAVHSFTSPDAESEEVAVQCS